MMLVLRQSTQLRPRVFAACHRKNVATQSQPVVDKTSSAGEYTEEARYPKIKNLSFKSRKAEEAMDWHEQIRCTSTVEEKLIKINMPRYYGFKVVQLSDKKLPYNSLPAMQHYTRTVFENMKSTAESEDPTKQKQQTTFVEAVKGDVVAAIEFVHDFIKNKGALVKMSPDDQERFFAQNMVEHVNRALLNGLAADYPHLQDVEVDYNPRHEAFWSVGGIDPPKNVVKSKEGRDWQKDMAKDPVDRYMQYIGEPYLTVRHRLQLPTWKSEVETENTELVKQIPRFNYDPRTLGWLTGYQHATNIPGYWPDSPSGFGCISYQSRAVMQIRPESYGADDFKDALHTHAIQSSYAWLLAEANYNGFNTYNELTYPMNTQTIITNGRDWSFYEYQLNTLLVHSNHVDDNPRVNFCRGSAELQLYGDVSKSGKCIDLNDEVLRHLVKFYANAPTIKRTSNELLPYVDTSVATIANYSNADKREFLERTFKHMVSNRPRHLALPEIYLWEKIYKIDNKTRQMDSKRRFFELNINPWKRTLDQHQKEYVPRRVRPEGPKSRKKWKQMYYP